jgi:hypothetical protein
MVDLNTLIPPGSAMQLATALNINDLGEIAGAGILPNGDTHPFLLIPCDENHPGVEGCDYDMVEASTAGPRIPAFGNESSRTLPHSLRTPDDPAWLPRSRNRSRESMHNLRGDAAIVRQALTKCHHLPRRRPPGRDDKAHGLAWDPTNHCQYPNRAYMGPIPHSLAPI